MIYYKIYYIRSHPLDVDSNGWCELVKGTLDTLEEVENRLVEEKEYDKNRGFKYNYKVTYVQETEIINEKDGLEKAPMLQTRIITV